MDTGAHDVARDDTQISHFLGLITETRKVASCSSETLKSNAGSGPAGTGCPVSNPDNLWKSPLFRGIAFTVRGHLKISHIADKRKNLHIGGRGFGPDLLCDRQQKKKNGCTTVLAESNLQKKVLLVVFDLQGSRCMYAGVVDRRCWLRFWRPGWTWRRCMVGTRSSLTPSRSTHTCHPLFGMQKKSKNRILLRLFVIVSLLISQWTLNLQGSVHACVRQAALYMYMFEWVAAKRKDIYRIDTFEW